MRAFTASTTRGASSTLKVICTTGGRRKTPKNTRRAASASPMNIPRTGVKQNGLMTQGEDTADNGGMHLAFMALESALARAGKDMDAKNSDGWTPRQEFFLSAANEWCDNERPELLRTQVLTDPHSVAKYRVNNVVANMPEFQKAFSCKKGQPMVRVNACRLW